MKKKVINIQPGVKLTVINTDKFKTDFFSIDFIDDLDEKRVSKNALLPRVLLRGTRKYSDMQKIQTQLDLLYGTTINPGTGKIGKYQIFGFSGYFLNERYAEGILDGVMDLYNELLFNPCLSDDLFLQNYVDGEKNILKDMVLSKINNKTSYAIKRCGDEMLKGTPMAISATGEIFQIDNVNTESLTSEYYRVMDNCGIEIYYVGGTEADIVESKVRKLHFPNTDLRICVKDVNVVKKEIIEPKFVKEEQQISQAKLSIGFLTGINLKSSNYYDFAVAREIFGGSAQSKLFNNVREKMSLCYYCQAIPDGINGMMIVASGIERDNYEAAKKEIMNQLSLMTEDGITDNELDFAKKSIINSLKEITDDAGAMKGWEFNRDLIGIHETLDEALQKIEKVTVRDVVKSFENVVIDTEYLLCGGENMWEEENG